MVSAWIVALSSSAAADRLVVRDFAEAGADYAFMQWQEGLALTPDGLEVGGAETYGQGGAGLNTAIDASDLAAGLPVLRVRLGEHNTADAVFLELRDADGTVVKFRYDLGRASAAAFTDLYPRGDVTLGNPPSPGKPGGEPGLDLANLTRFVLLGNWAETPVHFTLAELAITDDPPGEAPAAVADDDGRVVVRDFRRRGTDFSFLSWEQAAAQGPAGLTLGGPGVDGKGGVGLNQFVSAGAMASGQPVLRVRLGEANRANRIFLEVRDGDGTTVKFGFDLARADRDGFRDLYPIDGSTLGDPASINKPGDDPGLDTSNLTTWSILGHWQDTPFHVEVESLTIGSPPEPVRARQLEQRLAKMAPAERTAWLSRRVVLEGASHPADGPEVVAVYALGPTQLGVQIQDRRVEPAGQEPYVSQPGDRIRYADKNKRWYWEENGGMRFAGKDVQVVRPEPGGGDAVLGQYVARGPAVWPGPHRSGQAILADALALPAAYRLTSPDDPAYAAALEPLGVHVKRKPNGYRGHATLVTVYLDLPAPLRDGATYRVGFHGLNTAQAGVDYTHDTTRVRSEPVHASHVGYRPDDPYKAGKLSVWRGTGGAWDFEGVPRPIRFELIDEQNGDVVYRGQATLAKAADESESLNGGRNFAQTPVYALDFSDFNEPGTYRLHVPGVGTSDPLTIANDTWADAFALSMKGIWQHRSGYEIGPPQSAFSRPPAMMPGLNVEVYPVDVTKLDGESDAINAAAERFARLEPADRPEPVAHAWGGYMDAGDWDRRSNHLTHGILLLELIELFPEALADLPLALREDEATNRLPDTLDEALWNVDFFMRIQEPDGGVRGGIESSAHPRHGETSWQESLFVGLFAPDPVTSWLFAANAARAARLLDGLDSERAAAYRDAAVRAYDWAHAHRDAVIDAMRNAGKRGGARRAADEALNLAAVELYRLTAEPGYHEDFKATTELNTKDGPGGKLLRQETAIFAYARMPGGLADPELQAKARRFILESARTAIDFTHGNAFNLASADAGIPVMGWVGYFTIPGNLSQVLPRAYVLTGDDRYLDAVLRSTQFGVGVNPDNRAFTTGLGPNPPVWPLHLDSRHSGQPAPVGITICGPSDPAADHAFERWAHQWVFADMMTPDSETWPAYEAYTDIAVLPSYNEYTINLLFKNAYTWGVLAARPDR
ncbi:MAG: glycoside hydrolase family 9 protein [Planctomycetota bacterium]